MSKLGNFTRGGWENPNSYRESQTDTFFGRLNYNCDFWWAVTRKIWKPIVIVLIYLIFHAITLVGTPMSDTIKAFTFH